MTNEIDHIESGHGALIWAIGCIWAAYVERYWSKARTTASVTGFVILLVLVVPFSLAFVVWYAVSLGDLGFAGVNGTLSRLTVIVSVLALAGIAAPAQWQWRATAVALFPFLALAAFLATAWIGLKVSQSITSLAWPHGWIWFSLKEGIAGTAFGVTLATVLALPFSLVYRGRAVFFVTLALMPEFATWAWKLSDRNVAARAQHDAVFSFLAFVWPWVCTLIAVAICTRLCNRWLPRWPERILAD